MSKLRINAGCIYIDSNKDFWKIKSIGAAGTILHKLTTQEEISVNKLPEGFKPILEPTAISEYDNNYLIDASLLCDIISLTKGLEIGDDSNIDEIYTRIKDYFYEYVKNIIIRKI